MAKIEVFNDLNSIMESGEVQQHNRNYLGYSGLGGPCTRKIWYGFRWVADRTASRRMTRIWNRGDIEEGRIITDLNRVGCTVTCDQMEVVGITGHVKGHIDGIAEGVPTAPKTKKDYSDIPMAIGNRYTPTWVILILPAVYM